MTAARTITTPSAAVQKALLLHGTRQPYQLATIPLPELEQEDEVLIKIEAIGLNPVDWKSPDYGFGLPSLPCVSGRDLAGTVVKVGSAVKRIQVGDKVFCPSTQYRDYRTSAFQEFAVALESSLGLVPSTTSVEECAAIGVGAVTAALALTSSLGVKVRGLSPRDLAIGAEGESASDKARPERADMDEWLLIWGGSSVTGFFAAQFARHAGLRIIAVADVARHRNRLLKIGVNAVVDRSNPAAAVEEIRRITFGRLRFAIDCIGKETAVYALQALNPDRQSYLVGLSGVPKGIQTKTELLQVPVKTFHTNPAVGRGIMRLIEDLLESDELVLPTVEVLDGGLESVNGALDRLRVGDVGFGRLVIRVNPPTVTV